MELEVSRDHRIDIEANGFPICTRPRKYFWLCADCSQKYVLCRWTSSGVVLLSKQSPMRDESAKRKDAPVSKPPHRIHNSTGLEAKLQEAV